MEFNLDDINLDGSGQNEAGTATAATAIAVDPAGPAPTPWVAPDIDTAIIWDIETGPRPWEEIAGFYESLPPIEPWSDSMVKYGNTKNEDKRKEKYDQVKAEYDSRVANFEAEQAAHRAAWLDKAALSPITGRVLAIGYQVAGQPFVVGAECSESELLRNFWEGWYQRAKADQIPLVGFNIFGFDLPFMIRRSWLLNIDVPADVLVDRRYWSRVFIDLMAVWNCGAREFIKLDMVAQYFGGPRKNGDGAEFGRLWFEDRSAAVEYLKQDLAVTAEVARRMGVL